MQKLSQNYAEQLKQLDANITSTIQEIIAAQQEVYLIDCLEEELDERIENDGFDDMLQIEARDSFSGEAYSIAVFLVGEVGVYFRNMHTEEQGYVRISELYSIQDRVQLLAAMENALALQERDGMHQKVTPRAEQQ